MREQTSPPQVLGRPPAFKSSPPATPNLAPSHDGWVEKGTSHLRLLSFTHQNLPPIKINPSSKKVYHVKLNETTLIGPPLNEGYVQKYIRQNHDMVRSTSALVAVLLTSYYYCNYMRLMLSTCNDWVNVTTPFTVHVCSQISNWYRPGAVDSVLQGGLKVTCGFVSCDRSLSTSKTLLWHSKIRHKHHIHSKIFFIK